MLYYYKAKGHFFIPSLFPWKLPFVSCRLHSVVYFFFTFIAFLFLNKTEFSFEVRITCEGPAGAVTSKENIKRKSTALWIATVPVNQLVR